MNDFEKEQLCFCAFCPNPCRITFPESVSIKESLAASAMAYLAYASLNGYVEVNKEIIDHLQQGEAVLGCNKSCPHTINTPDLIGKVLKEIVPDIRK